MSNCWTGLFLVAVPPNRANTRTGTSCSSESNRRTTPEIGLTVLPKTAPRTLAESSVYFHDPDGNLLELISMLPEDPRPELGVVNWSRWIHDGQSDQIPRTE